MTFETKVQGIPCHCRITLRAANPEDFDIQLTDQQNRRIFWLEHQLKPDERYQLLDEFQAYTLAQKYGIEY